MVKALKLSWLAGFALAAVFIAMPPAHACTGITLKAADGAVVYGRTLEWGAFDMLTRINLVPVGHKYVGQTPDGKPGLKWTTKYGFVGFDAMLEDDIVEGMNEKGLAVGLFYLPGFAEYQKYEPSKAAESIAPTQMAQLLLGTCENIAQVRQALDKIRVVPVVEKKLGFPAPAHYLITEPSGKAIVVEYIKGHMNVYDAPLGVITNSPGYDWHLINLRNYVNLSAVAIPDKKIDEMDFKPLGQGSGMIGLPGDFTPPSRFVRAVAFSQTARPTPDGPETRYEVFRILDNFNVPLHAAEGSDQAAKAKGLRSSTLWTSVSDTKNKVIYYHTQHNRRVRMIDLKRIDFKKLPGIAYLPLDKVKAEDIEDVTPAK